MKKQPTLKQLKSKLNQVTKSNFRKEMMELEGTELQIEKSTETYDKHSDKLNEMCELVTDENPDYSEICRNGFLDGM